MKTVHRRLFLLMPLLWACACLGLIGCKSTPKVDWNSRVGTYTYDQAVESMGPPDRTAKLSDGRTVAEWVHRSSGGISFGLGTGYSSSGTAVGVGQSVGTGYSNKVLRLVFSPDNKLESWSKNY
jgi:hypothetical protein